MSTLGIETLMERMAGGESPRSMLQAWAEQAGADHPQGKLIAQWLASRPSPAVEANPEPEPAAVDAEPARPTDPGRRAAVQQLRQIAQSMYQELEILRARNDSLAEALGACHLCWGEDPACEVCAGRGGPGFALPRRAQFSRLVVPAARRLKLSPVPGKSPEPAPPQSHP